MKKILIGIAVLAVAAGAAAFLYRDEIGMMMAFNRLKPEHSFAAAPPPLAPDYSLAASWGALPDRADAADVVPNAEVQDRQATAEVDVFFVHPTTFFGTAGWNQSLDDTSTNQLTDTFVLRGQASVFNGCCRIYAPRYRQATIYSFMDGSGSGKAALQLAYEDVERAFDYFIEHYNQGRPFILASHSQGSVHVRTLLERRITGTALRERLVAAYPIGFGINREEMAKAVPDVPVCESAEQIGCVVTWNAVGPKAQPWGDPRKNICVNPLTWRADGAAAEASLNLGGVAYPGTFEGTLADVKGVPEDFIAAKPVLETAVADAQCVDGMLLVKEIHSKNYAARPMGRDNYHIYDYGLFHMNLGKNVEQRVAAYLQSRALAQPQQSG
ncbi:MAG TPA: DUF3089 domain-containing protein [Steroidobacteraceae bacterium]|nr:DUF3089 domain-containing protein [Steroidobacteraceae bacterium]